MRAEPAPRPVKAFAAGFAVATVVFGVAEFLFRYLEMLEWFQ